MQTVHVGEAMTINTTTVVTDETQCRRFCPVGKPQQRTRKDRASLAHRKKHGRPGSQRFQRWLNELALGRDPSTIIDFGVLVEDWNDELNTRPVSAFAEINNEGYEWLMEQFLDITDDKQQERLRELLIAAGVIDGECESKQELIEKQQKKRKMKLKKQKQKRRDREMKSTRKSTTTTTRPSIASPTGSSDDDTYNNSPKATGFFGDYMDSDSEGDRDRECYELEQHVVTDYSMRKLLKKHCESELVKDLERLLSYFISYHSESEEQDEESDGDDCVTNKTSVKEFLLQAPTSEAFSTRLTSDGQNIELLLHNGFHRKLCHGTVNYFGVHSQTHIRTIDYTTAKRSPFYSGSHTFSHCDVGCEADYSVVVVGKKHKHQVWSVPSLSLQQYFS